MDLHAKMARMGDKIRWLVIGLLAVTVTTFPVGQLQRLSVYGLLAVGAVYNYWAATRIPWESLPRGRMRLIVLGFVVADVLEISAIVYLTGGIVSFVYPFLIFDLLFTAFFFRPVLQALTCSFVILCDGFVVFVSAVHHGTPTTEAFWQFFARACLYGLVGWFPSVMARVIDTEREKNENIVNNLKDGIIVLNHERQVTAINPRAQGMLDAPAEAIVGRCITQSGTLLGNQRLGAVLEDLAAGSPVDFSAPSQQEFELPEPNPLDLRVLTVPVGVSRHKPAGWLIVCQDIGDVKELERMRSQAVSYVSHELRGPLTNIKLYASSLRDRVVTLTPETQREYISAISHEVDRLAELVASLLDSARLQAGETPLQCERLSLSEQLALAHDLCRLQAEEQGLTFHVSAPAALPDVLADQDRLMQVFRNVIGNALKFTPAGGTVRVSAAAEDELVRVSVSDTGPGIPEDRLAVIFEKFVQLGDDQVAAGAGLGLAICKEIVERLGGRIWAESKEGEGSTFHFTVPIWASDRD